jgi:hypothetical protein
MQKICSSKLGDIYLPVWFKGYVNSIYKSSVSTGHFQKDTTSCLQQLKKRSTRVCVGTDNTARTKVRPPFYLGLYLVVGHALATYNTTLHTNAQVTASVLKGYQETLIDSLLRPHCVSLSPVVLSTFLSLFSTEKREPFWVGSFCFVRTSPKISGNEYF